MMGGHYLDYAATTPVDPRVAAAMAAVLEHGPYGNPSSATHAWGREAAQAVERARAQVAALLGAHPSQIVFTSGATESDNIAVLGVARAAPGGHVITARTEHKAVRDACRRLERESVTVTYLVPDASGRVTPEAVARAIHADTALVSLMHVNNETGVVQDIAGIGAVARARGVAFHTDAAQSAGRIRLDLRRLPVDLLSLTAHKLCGPKGIGALYVADGMRRRLQPLMSGGGQEAGLRPGTLATHQVVGFGAACELAAAALDGEHTRLAGLRRQLLAALVPLGGVLVNGDEAVCVPDILNVSFEDVEGESLVAGLSGLAVSTGAACDSARNEPSYVLRALGRGAQLAESSLRFSFGRFTVPADIEYAAAEVGRVVGRLRSVSPRRAHSPPADPGQGAARGPVMDPAGAAGADFSAGTDLSAPVRELFETLPHAGVIEDAAGLVARGEAGGGGSAWVRFHLLVAGGRVTDARFQAQGCPHTLAAAAWVAGRLPGRDLAQGVPDCPQEWARALAVPVEKLGRLLTIEDALRAALAAALDAAPGAVPAAAP